MNIKKTLLRNLGFLFIGVIALVQFSCPVYAADLQVFENVRLINNTSNDGDSFFVYANGKNLHLRLYFVDCPETSASFKSDAIRIREQTRYFGLAYSTDTIHFGKEAKVFTKNALEKPFTIHTAFANALGRTLGGRVYAFVTTAKGKDLASLLVENGYARAYGTGRKIPGGLSRDEMFEVLRDVESSAMLKRIGIWAKSNPDKIAEFRAEQRKEDNELKEIVKGKKLQGLLNPNTATSQELQSIKGIGPVTARRIIAGRPYNSIGDLLRVKGIGPKRLEKLRRSLNMVKE